MDTDAFRMYLRRGGRSESAARSAARHVAAFADYLHTIGATLDAVTPTHLESYVDHVESGAKTSAKKHLWALRYYFQFSGNDDLASLTSDLRQQRIQRTPFPLQDFRGIDPNHLVALADAGITHIEHLHAAARTPANRAALAAQTGVPPAAILKLTRLSDLARIPGVKGIRARLYHDSGFDTLDKLAACDPAELRAFLLDWVERTGFDGIAPLPKEAAFTVKAAQSLPRIIQFE
jgi:hypothetical protein